MNRGTFGFPDKPTPNWWLEDKGHVKNIGVSAARGTVALATGQVILLIVRLLGTFILSRLLMPEDFGLVAMAAVVTVFAALFTDLGLSVATIRAAKLDHVIVNTLFRANVFAGLAIAGVLIGFSGAFGSFFGDDRVAGLICVLSITLPLNASAAQHGALLTRAMRWQELQAIAVVPAIVSLAVAIVSILLGLGYWAIAIQSICTSLLTVLLTWFFCTWRPGRTLDWRRGRAELKTGSNIAAFALLNWLHRQGDNMLIGRYIGASALGYYARAYTLYMLPLSLFNGPLKSACLPMLSKLQADPVGWRNGALDTLAIATLVGALFATIITASAESLVMFVLGPQWGPSIDIFRWLSLSYLIASPASMMGTILISRGQTRRLLVSGAINCPMLLLAYYLALPYGPDGVAAAYTMTLTLQFVPTMWYSLKGSSLSLTSVLRQIVPLAIAGAAALAVSETFHIASEHGVVLQLVLSLVLSVTVFLVMTSLVIFFDPAQARLKSHIEKVVRHGRGLAAKHGIWKNGKD